MATIEAASILLADVQAAINAAASGDTIRVPAGNEDWAEGTADVPSAKRLTIIGAGKASSLISTGSIDINMSNSRISGFGMSRAYTSSNNRLITVSGGTAFRIDNCSFTYTSNHSMGVFVRGEDNQPIGVIDHCDFHNARVYVYADAGLSAWIEWAKPLGLGTNNAVFIEDCTFENTDANDRNAVDSHYGGRYVFRHNTITDHYVEAHSTSDENNRGARSWEVYNNTIIQTTWSIYRPFRLRGGTGVVFNNIVTGTYGNPSIALDNGRTISSVCNGLNSIDENTPGQDGWACRDQIGRGGDDWEWTVANPNPTQASSPAYAWDNVYDGSSTVVFEVINDCSPHIQANRDYFDATLSGYVSYTYPHPLQGTAADCYVLTLRS